MKKRALDYTIALCLSMVMSTSAAWAQPADLPTAEALFAAADRAHGWSALKADLGTIEAHATVTVKDPTGNTAYKTVVRGKTSGNGPGDASFALIRPDGTTVYSETDGVIHRTAPDGTVQQLAPEMAAYVRGHQFHRRTLYPALELATINPEVEEVDFEGRRAFKVTGETQTGATLTYFYDERQKTILGLHLTVQEPDGPHPMSFVLRDWRDVDGSDIFYQIDIQDRSALYIYRFSKILLLP
ncbi:hypothetical protein [Kordiimonas sp.]|uniref:hypothetical protein n=1 Tax=Kordiimonas sp. TaxID=1970157 RepID=UPI003A8F9D4C